MKGSVTSIGKQHWRIVVDAPRDASTGRRRQITRHVRGPKREAESKLARLLVEVGDGGHLRHDSTLEELVERWIESGDKSASYRRDLRYAAKHIGPALLRRPIWKVRAPDLDALYARLLAEGLGADRVRRVHTIISRALAQAVRWGWLNVNPAASASPPTAPKAKPNAPEPGDVAKMIAAADDDLLVFLALSASLGQRRGTTLALQWRDIDLDRAQVIIRRAVADGGRGVGLVVKGTKTDTEHVVAIDDATVALLRSYRASVLEDALAAGAALHPEAFVLSRDVDGLRPWRPDSMTRRVTKLRDALGIKVTTKQLRHYVATQLLAAGVDPRTVAGRLGHARTSTTLDIYAAFVPARDRDAADVLASVLRRSG